MDPILKQACCTTDCCSETNSNPVAAETIREQVRSGYGRIAETGSLTICETPGGEAGLGGCCGAGSVSADDIARAVGYSHRDLTAIPEGANMGLSCGNPTAISSLKPGEVVLDLGAGGGLDCFIAGPKVGATGRVIGVDMTPEMLSKARRNLIEYRQHSQLENVEFRLGEIENLPVADCSVDVVISNCVLNLSPDKPRVWKEIFRVLKPGGRVAVSDLALLRPLPDSVRSDVEALIGCVAGAVLIDETVAMAKSGGLVAIEVTRKGEYIDSMTEWQDPLYRKIIDLLPKGTRVGDFVTSVEIKASKE